MRETDTTTSSTVVDAGYDLTRGTAAARAIELIDDCAFTDAIADLIDALGRARWCERAPHRDPEDLDNLSSINPADFAAEWPWVEERFRYFRERPIAEVEAAADDIEAALNALRANSMSSLLSVQSEITGWSGKAKDAFSIDFVGPLAGTAIAEQQRLLAELQAGMWAYDVVLRQARLNAYHLAVETTKVLDSLAETSPNDAKIALGILAVVVGVVTAFESGGSALALGLISTGISAASTGVDAATTVTGDTTGEVMASLLSALDILTDEMNAAEQAIATAMTATQEAVEADLRKSESTLLPCEPDDSVVDLTSGGIPPKDHFRPKT
ncbi:hypothetical protein [Phytomonospora endophytica]|uniref:Uncharacterized protein n=1 Tax=Phytomonospora endophytica TaxID=714109 RepID=A0A841FWD8_9ACTN|nr:hypothetical protein [Phytomonospora endophytica]MBB6036290.1 hypothetical protein [Phytomonospora endophytica]GIG67197.1 hypothetical protein Pen01_34920 [Phytomonospora endophytica]